MSMTTRFSTYRYGALSYAKQIAVRATIGTALLSSGVPCALAQDGHFHPPGPHQEQTSEQKSQANALLQIVRESTERFKEVSAAEAEGYALQFGCVSGPD